MKRITIQDLNETASKIMSLSDELEKDMKKAGFRTGQEWEDYYRYRKDWEEDEKARYMEDREREKQDYGEVGI